MRASGDRREERGRNRRGCLPGASFLDCADPARCFGDGHGFLTFPSGIGGPWLAGLALAAAGLPASAVPARYTGSALAEAIAARLGPG